MYRYAEYSAQGSKNERINVGRQHNVLFICFQKYAPSQNADYYCNFDGGIMVKRPSVRADNNEVGTKKGRYKYKDKGGCGNVYQEFAQFAAGGGQAAV